MKRIVQRETEYGIHKKYISILDQLKFLKRVLCFRLKAYLSFIYSGSEWFCLKIC